MNAPLDIGRLSNCQAATMRSERPHSSQLVLTPEQQEQQDSILYNTKFSAFWEIIISRATSGGRVSEVNSGSLPPIPGGL